MTDQPQPGLEPQVTTLAPQPPAAPAGTAPAGGPAGTPPAGYIELARYNGLNQKVQDLVLANQDLNRQLLAKTSELEQLRASLTVKDAEKAAAVTERDKSLNEIVQSKAALEAQLKELKALQLKVKIAKEIGHTELLTIADRIPAFEDENVLKETMLDFVNFAGAQVKAREEQLKAGVTPGAGPGAPVNSSPATAEQWVEHINGLSLGSAERAKAMDQYGDWLDAQHRK